jgi:uncharacterized protein (DUF1697 family)
MHTIHTSKSNLNALLSNVECFTHSDDNDSRIIVDVVRKELDADQIDVLTEIVGSKLKDGFYLFHS